jgi:hypothetical protein
LRPQGQGKKAKSSDQKKRKHRANEQSAPQAAQRLRPPLPPARSFERRVDDLQLVHDRGLRCRSIGFLASRVLPEKFLKNKACALSGGPSKQIMAFIQMTALSLQAPHRNSRIRYQTGLGLFVAFCRVQMSNFRFYQDRETGDLVIFLTRYGEQSKKEWMLADYYRYRMELPK